MAAAGQLQEMGWKACGMQQPLPVMIPPVMLAVPIGPDSDLGVQLVEYLGSVVLLVHPQLIGF